MGTDESSDGARRRIRAALRMLCFPASFGAGLAAGVVLSTGLAPRRLEFTAAGNLHSDSTQKVEAEVTGSLLLPQEMSRMMAAGLSDPSRRFPFQDAFLRWFAEDPHAALQWARSNGYPGGVGTRLHEAFSGWAAVDVDGARVAALSLATEGQRRSACAGIVSVLADSDFEGAVRFCLRNGELGEDMAADVLCERIAQAPEDTAAVSFRLLDSPNQRQRVFSAWADVDPETASAWMQTNLPESNERTAMLSGVVDILARSSPDKAIALWRSLPQGSARDNQACALALNLARTDPDVAAEFAYSLSGEAGRLAARGYAEALLKQESEGSQALFSALTVAPGRPMQRELLTSYVANAPNLEVAWDNLSGLADDALAHEAQRRLMGEWGRRSPEDALQFVEKLPQDDTSRELCRIVGSKLAPDPHKVSEFVGNLSQEMSASVLNGWIGANPGRISREIVDEIARAQNR